VVHLIFRHVSGSRATEVDVVLMDAHRELILGRAPSAAVRFDPRADSRVGRHHARIVRTDDDPAQFAIADLESRNGTFVNGVRVDRPVPIRPGDVIRLGEGGPELEVGMDVSSAPPRPPDGLRASS
jgi:pSer/pThr/pTyr-binding forkhead associated (FHA) protein